VGRLLKERDQLEDIGAEESIILKLIFNKWDVVAYTGFIWDGRQALAIAVINIRDSKNPGEFLHQLGTC
jgi:hypothetical protein